MSRRIDYYLQQLIDEDRFDFYSVVRVFSDAEIEPNLLHWEREHVLVPADAIAKMTLRPARRLGLARDVSGATTGIEPRGRLAPGYMAALVAFDPTTVSDSATFDDPHGYPTGIPHVVVNGALTLRDGEHTGDLGGRGVRGSGRVTGMR